jgi:hypothetical protein
MSGPGAARAALRIEQAEATLKEASNVIANGLPPARPAEWIRAVEKLQAAPETHLENADLLAIVERKCITEGRPQAGPERSCG